MAEASVEQRVAPLREAQRVLARASEMARALADDTLFNTLFAQLNALPGAASVNPLQASTQLPVDIPPAQQDAPQNENQHRQFVDALLQRAKETDAADDKAASGRMGNIGGNSGGMVASGQKATGTVALPASGLSPTPPEQTVTTAPPKKNVVDDTPATMGSWAALQRIAVLVRQLDAHPAATTPPGGWQEAPEPKGAPLPLASARAPAPGSGPWPAHIVPVARDHTATDSNSGSPTPPANNALPTLQTLVDDLWQASGRGGADNADLKRQSQASGAGGGQDNGTAQAQVASAPLAPRGPSMLHPQSAGGIGKPGAHPLSVSRSAESTAAGSNDRGDVLSPGETATDDEALADRLNRALIEQAWRGGVDLT